MARYLPMLQPLVLGAWVLLTPPTPLGTELPPLSDWSKVRTFESSADCEEARDAMRDEARAMLTRDPNASALQLADALGRVEARCVEDKTAPAAAPPKAKGDAAGKGDASGKAAEPGKGEATAKPAEQDAPAAPAQPGAAGAPEAPDDDE